MRLSVMTPHLAGALLLAAILACDESPTEPREPRRNVLFTSGVGDAQEVWAMKEDGTLELRITSNTVIDADPRWSNDGDIVVARARATTAPAPAPPPAFDLWIIDGADFNGRRLATSPTSDTLPTFSPDGETVAFISRDDASAGSFPRIHLIDVDGTNRRAISPAGVWVRTAAEWSPDGQALLFGARETPTGAMDLVVMRIDGTNAHTIPDPCAGDFMLGRWDPFDGRISITCRNGLEQPMYVMSSDGGDQRRITPPRPEQSSIGDFGGIWSPIGDNLFVMRKRDGIVIGLYSVNVNSLTADRLSGVSSASFALSDWWPHVPID